MEKITNVRYSGHRQHSSSTNGSDDSSDLAVIRRLAIQLATRNGQLQAECKALQDELWSEREQARALGEEMSNSHAQLLRLAQEQTDSERRRCDRLESELASDRSQIRKLEETLTALSSQKATMVAGQEYQEVRTSREEHARRVRELESELHALERSAERERVDAERHLEEQTSRYEGRLEQHVKRMKDLTEENAALQAQLRKKASEYTNLERQLVEASDIHADMKSNLDTCLSKNSQLVERMKIVERELSEHRVFSQRLKERTDAKDSRTAQFEMALQHLQNDLRDKERELVKSQELIRTLTAATRAATNELDTQLHLARMGVPIAKRPGSSTGFVSPLSAVFRLTRTSSDEWRCHLAHAIQIFLQLSAFPHCPADFHSNIVLLLPPSQHDTVLWHRWYGPPSSSSRGKALDGCDQRHWNGWSSVRTFGVGIRRNAEPSPTHHVARAPGSHSPASLVLLLQLSRESDIIWRSSSHSRG